ncbi:MAG: TonB-dependent receptor plug domain-containing protein [Sphingomonadaceae bacterium]
MPLAAKEPSGGKPASSNETSATQQSFPADFFSRFSPKNAMDMLNNLPGFQLRGDDDSDVRGLGQATANVLVNDERVTTKSDSLYDQLSRIPANSVVRIDIVDGAKLSIPGLSGQVADIITRPDKFSGQYYWRVQGRPHFSHPGYLDGRLSAKGTLGKVQYTIGLSNESDRGATGGPYRLLNGDGSLQESRDGHLWSDYDSPKFSAGITVGKASATQLNLNGFYRTIYDTDFEDETRVPVGDVARDWRYYSQERGHEYQLSGDYSFGLLGGRLKLIGLNRYRHDNYDDQAITSYPDGRASEGDRYLQSVATGEAIGRAEYSWKWGKADWQIAGEAAYNRLDKTSGLFDLDPDGTFVQVPFPGGNGGVREDRYDASISYGRPLTDRLTLQVIAAAETSTIRQTGANALSRTFFRPKGSASLAWTPEKGLDISLKVERQIGQLDFNDFLARIYLDQGNANGDNAQLVPSQIWNVDLETKKNLGKWGTTDLRLYGRFYQDYIDVIPLPGGGEGRGNIPHARRYGFEWTSTFQLDPLGFKGAKIDSDIIAQTSALTDPLTGEKRQISGMTDRYANISLRHDIPHSNWAWGAGIEAPHVTDYYRVGEYGYQNEGPLFDFYFIENKDVLGMTVKFQVVNLANARHKLYRTVYTGPRDSSPVSFIEDRSQLIGPIFRLSVKGNF